MSQYKRKPSPAKKIAILTFYWILQLLPFFCLLNKPSTHKHAEWSGKSSLTLVKEVTSRAEMAACHFPCQGDICHSLLSCFFWGGNEPSPQQGWSSSPAPVPLFCFWFFFPENFAFFLLFWSPSFRRDKSSVLQGFYVFSKILILFLLIQ